MISPTPIELLCPTKNVELGIAAINHGADAVYIGYERFGARTAAGNSLADIETLIRYAHMYRSKVYITLNTILYESELDETQSLIHSLYQIGADALIIQDMGILEMDIPPIPLHASTQTHNNDTKKVEFLQNVGFERVILARELSINEIAEIKNNTTIQLEAFIHGALCVSYSGHCYFSHAITGRSANRGECAQPCRSRYNLVDENGKLLVKDKHLLSLKDLNQSQNINGLIQAGVCSLKIEGRLKDINYVKNITAHYRTILDKIINEDTSLIKSSSGKVKFSFTPDPERTFNRTYTTHFAEGRQKGLVSVNTQKSLGKYIGKVDIVSSTGFSIITNETITNNDGLCFIDKKGVLQGFKVNKIETNHIFPHHPIDIYIGAEIYRNYDHAFNKELNGSPTSVRQIECRLVLTYTKNDLAIEINDEDGFSSVYSVKNTFEDSKNPDKTIETIEVQLKKSASTPFTIVGVQINGDRNHAPFTPISIINSWRRELFEKHIKHRTDNYPLKRVILTPNSIEYPNKSLTYKANIVNHLAKAFYERHGVKDFEWAFELQDKVQNSELMETKYCILFELGYCDGKKKKKGTPPKLFLTDDQMKYSLSFNCSECKMLIKKAIT